MDGASLVLSIPGTFTSCVECFRYVRFAKSFKQDFGLCLTTLEVAELSLTRWGTAMGIVPGEQLKGDFDEKDLRKAHKWLDRLEQAFKNAKVDWNDLLDEEGGQPALLETEVALGKMDKTLKALHISVNKTNKNRVHFKDRVQWALYKREEFQTFTNSVYQNVQGLVTLFPATSPIYAEQQKLCDQEVESIKQEDASGILALREIVAASPHPDPLLATAVNTEVEDNRAYYNNVTMSGGRAQLGDTVASGEKVRGTVFNGLKITGGRFQGGHNIGDIKRPTVLEGPDSSADEDDKQES